MRNLLMTLAMLLISVQASAGEGGKAKATGSYGAGKNAFRLATGSPGELGLLKELAEAFPNKADARLDWVKAGSGESLCDGAACARQYDD